ncbi:FeoB-associated Cys-rich membrane protein [Leadbettera azotonutricia]|uniref:FeoB-associated Cys-rich membrane protein n=1 Tax=Leadbettera azotonutricia (strain ATCC BAA-888 / DSM 13862 / ZAS-9) TaxID=545695 RepID=F5YEA4_LEAAZ|nr:FeoB-associated Cys-rich membrane protein [Leadbettera azotonutricia]AEF82869.1 conserved hypothetical protein [Leadbettera azotonutricia ZAS-9]
MKEFLSTNGSTIIVGAIVFAALAFVLIRLIRNLRRGKAGCGCGCSDCTASAGRVPAANSGLPKK